MTSRKAAVYGVGATLLVTYFAGANMPTQESPSRERAERPAATAGAESLAVEVRSQAAKLQARLAQAPVPDANPRNPFSFGLASHAARSVLNRDGRVHAAVAEDPAAPAAGVPPLPALTLMGIAEETTVARPRRTAVTGGAGGPILMGGRGQPVGARVPGAK